MLLAGIAGVSYWAIRSQHNEQLAEEKSRQAIEALISALSTAPPSQVPAAIDALRPFREESLALLQRQFEELTEERKLHIAYGLAELGQIEVQFLIDSIGEAGQGECENLVAALAYEQESAQEALLDAVRVATAKQDWILKTRLATVALYLDDTRIAAEMLRAEPKPGETEFDPVQRTMFIEHVPICAGSISQLTDVFRPGDGTSLRSGICLAIGGTNEPSADAKKRWQELWAQWYESQPDSGTHSATGWALRTWDVAPPEIPKQQSNRDQFHWQETKAGLTMVLIPAGGVERPESPNGGKARKTIRIENEFWLSDREVTVGQFLGFLNDKEAEKPKEPAKIAQYNNGNPSLPVVAVSWYDALMFCNWLSRQEGRDPCYAQEGKEKIRGVSDEIRECDAWKLIPGANGYRLPTEDEWEYACRARTTTAFSFGDNEDLLDRYAVFVKNAENGPELVGRRLCNAWGLFDMHGNVIEWCQDWYKEGSFRAVRDGCWGAPALFCRSAYRGGYPPDTRSNFVGFRVATGPTASHSSPAGEASEAALDSQ